MENTITRKYLVETLRNLLTDEYDAEDLVVLTDAELIQKIIDAAFWYQEECGRYQEDSNN